MWSLKNTVGRKTFKTLAALACVSVLSACSFTPLYGDNSAVGSNLNLSYADPNTRIEQVIYQDLKLRLGREKTVDAPLVTVSASTGSRRVGRTSSGSPATTYEATVTASVSVSKQDIETDITEQVYSISRSASATYTTNGQRLADQQALEEANERAALSVAKTLRLLLAAELPSKL